MSYTVLYRGVNQLLCWKIMGQMQREVTVDRFSKLRAVAERSGVDAVVIVPGANLRYLTGLEYHAGERLAVAVLPVKGDPAFVLPAMEEKRVKSLSRVPFHTFPWSDAEPSSVAMRRCIESLGLSGKTLAAEHLSMRLFELRAIEAAAPRVIWIDANPLMTELRIVKDAEELTLIREAGRLIDAAL